MKMGCGMNGIIGRVFLSSVSPPRVRFGGGLTQARLANS